MILKKTIFFTTVVLAANRKTACWAVLFFTVFAHRYSASNMLAFHTEWCAMFFSTAGAYLFLKYLFKAGNIFIFFSGLSFSLVFFSKQPALLDFLTAIFFCLISNRITAKENAQPAINPCIYMAAGFFLPVIIIVVYYRLNNALSDFWFYFWVYNDRYYAAATSVLQRIQIAFSYLINPKGFFMVNYLLVLSFCCAGFIAVKRFFQNYKNLTGNYWLTCIFFLGGYPHIWALLTPEEIMGTILL